MGKMYIIPNVNKQFSCKFSTSRHQKSYHETRDFMDMAMVGIARSFEQKYMYSSTYSVSLFDQIVHPRKDAQNDGLESHLGSDRQGVFGVTG